MDHEVVKHVIGVFGLLLVASLAVVGFRRARLPYTVGLVLVGLVLGPLVARAPALAPLASIELSPGLIMFVFLPTLIFEAAFNLDSRLLMQNLAPVMMLAVPGLLLSTALIGGVIAFATPVPWGPSLLFGALISATDPVAVVALFKEVGAPKRLGILVEGESVFNDATAIVLFHIVLAVVLGGAVSAATVIGGAASFLRVFVGGLVVGGVIGWLLVRSIALAGEDALVEVSLSIVVAYAAFIAAEHYLHVSGVMATVSAGVVVGTYGVPRFTSASRRFLHRFWEFAAFVANGLIFLLVGLSIRLSGLAEFAGPIAWAIAAALVARLVVVFGLLPLIERMPGVEPVDGKYKLVLWWGGLRGAVGLALAYSLTSEFTYRREIIAMSVGVVLFTLLASGLSMGRVIAWLGLDRPGLVDRLARAQSNAAAVGEASSRLERLEASGHYSASLLAGLRRSYAERTVANAAQLAALRAECLGREVRAAIWTEALAAERAVYQDLQDRGFITEPVRRELELSVDLERDEVARQRFSDVRATSLPLEARFTDALFRLIARVAPGNRWVHAHRLGALAARYEHEAAQADASRRVAGQLGALAVLAGDDASTADSVRAVFERREKEAVRRIDRMAEHFPEYVAAVQRTTAERIALDGEADAIEALAKAGSIPPSVAHAARAAVRVAQRRLARQPVEHLAPKPEELLEQVSMFRGLARDAFAQVVARLRPRTVLEGEDIIRQGERGSSLFLIARGVVAVLRVEGGVERRVASLHAGEFFGEMALLSGDPRSATVRAATECQLYELARKDVDDLTGVCVGLQEALEQADAQRRAAAEE